MKLESILSSREKMALNLLFALEEIGENPRVEFEIEKGHVISLKLGWINLQGEMDLLCYFRGLKTLELWNCRIGAIPEEFALLTHLRALTISFFDMAQAYEITDLVPTIFFLSALEELTLEQVIMNKEVEEAVGDLSNLIKLHLNHCGFCRFPPSFYNLYKLKDLSLAGNNIDEFPEKLFTLPLDKFFITNQFKMNFKNETESPIK
uniref:Leucine Rich repeats (2 copies) n=1 Tax=Promethearchaeum syntrophicum TaxID=2594042 RepID=A0A5B9DG44_9ARCH|nr:hypothetical protein [Candidatus Prometheoarchaeum syntrophicum]QEE17753.1 Leucine Rich repeats (2 copies) [Candidatus Prometheoarchaeum syntrophicum]